MPKIEIPQSLFDKNPVKLLTSFVSSENLASGSSQRTLKVLCPALKLQLSAWKH